MPTDRERRTNPRFVCELMTFLQPADGDPLAGESADLSLGGVSARVERELVVGTGLEVVLTLSLGWSEADFLRIPATIVWCRPDGGAFAIGAQFHELPESEHRRLEVLVRLVGGELDALRAQV